MRSVILHSLATLALMIRHEKEDGRFVPRIYCDGCAQAISEGAGTVQWYINTETFEPIGGVSFFHKGHGDSGRKEAPGITMCWEELDIFWGQLLLNTGIEPDAAMMKARRWAGEEE